MAVDQDLLDQIASTVADLYREVEGALVKTIAQRLRADLPLPSPFQETKLDSIRKLQASARLILASLQATRAKLIREAIAKAYRSGGDAAVADLPEKWFPKSGIGQQARAATQVVPNARVMENIAQALHRDVGRLDSNILRAPVDAYRAVQAGAAARINSGSYTRREASQAAWQRLMDRGIVDFTDRAGRRWKLSTYVEMMARTNIQRAAVQGQTDRLAAIGIDLVYISDNVQECKRCRPFESKVLRRDAGPTGKIRVEHATRDGEFITVDVLTTLDQARAKGLFHPNCRHSASAYLPGVTTLKKGTEDPEGDKARQKQRALERRIRAAKERQVGALTPEAKKQAGADVRAAQTALRGHLAAHPKLKRLTYREQIGAGNIPKTGGPSGGPTTDLGPTVQPTIDGEPGATLSRHPTPEPEQARAEQARVDVPGQLSLDDVDTSKAQHKAIGALTDNELADRFNRALESGDEAEIERVAAEMARRDEPAQQPTDHWGSWGDVEISDDDRRVDALVARGWDYVDAYAEVFGLDPEQLRREERRAALNSDRRPGETLDQTVSRLYRDWIHTQWLQAENATNGYLLNKAGEAEGIDPISLFSGPLSRSKKYASEELRRWWNTHQRMTLTEFRAQILGRESDKRSARTTREMGDAGI
ncbi:phage minor capsid protein [Nonomuraea sp. NPDC026600]|uniref:phage minor capsid protein n=1 Tax=Nonomuraea sp. NPDC026600 TaxID=3155363 RepID=UPI0033D9D7F8